MNSLPNSTTPATDSQLLTSQQPPPLDQQIGQPTVSPPATDSQLLTSQQPPALDQQIGQPTVSPPATDSQLLTSQQPPALDQQIGLPPTNYQPPLDQQVGLPNIELNGYTPGFNTVQPITILQVLDSNNQPIINDSTTSSSSIALHLQPNENVPIQNVQCFIDNSPIMPCSNNPVIIDNLQQGNHVFQLQVIDGSGILEPRTSTFRWTVVPQTPEQMQQQQQATTTATTSNSGTNTRNTSLSFSIFF